MMKEKQIEEEWKRHEMQFQKEKQMAIMMEKERIAKEYEEAASYHE